jgi:hypothetical protein
MVGTWSQAMADHVGLAIELPKDSALIQQPPAVP